MCDSSSKQLPFHIKNRYRVRNRNRKRYQDRDKKQGDGGECFDTDTDSDANPEEKLLLFLILALMAFLVFYKGYLFIFERDYDALNAGNIDRIEALIGDRDTFSFAVVGNVKNSMKIFNRRIAPLLKKGHVDFLISAGNAVYDGAEDKYRMLNRSFKDLDIPYILAVGTNEVADFGVRRFYRHFGPLFFSFDIV